MNKILIIEDEKNLCKGLAELLENSGYITECVDKFEHTFEKMCEFNGDIILLDINLPGIDGETLLQNFRKISDTPVIMLTSRTSELDEALSMSMGADDYITKPYNPIILLLRISAVLKRTKKTEQRKNYRNLTVNVAKGSIVCGENEEILTKNEMIIFELMLDRRGEIVSRDELMTALWNSDEFVNDNTLSVNISRLRGKLAHLGLDGAIETRKKQGYILK